MKKKETITVKVHTHCHLWGREKKTKLTDEEKIVAELFFNGQLMPTHQYDNLTYFECTIDGQKYFLLHCRPSVAAFQPSLAIHDGKGPRGFGARCVMLRGGRLTKSAE